MHNNLQQPTAPANGGGARPVKKSPAPWVGASFVPVPREFFAVMHELSKTAKEVYFGHLANALASGGNAGHSNQYRDNFAAKYHFSTAKVDRGNAELEARGMVKKSPRFHQNAQDRALLPPSRWLFDSLKNASPKPQNCALGDAKLRPITKGAKKESFKTNSAGANFVVADSLESVPGPTAATTDAERALIEIGVSPKIAAILCENNSSPEIFQQIAWLDARKPRSRPATLIQAIRGRWSAPEGPRDAVGAPSWQRPQTDVSNAPAREIYKSVRPVDAHASLGQALVPRVVNAEKTPETAHHATTPELPVEIEFDESDFEGEMFQGVAPEAGSLALLAANLRDGATFEELMGLRVDFYEVDQWRALIERAREEL